MDEIIFFDLETTGTDISKDRIVELSVIKTDFNNSFTENKTLLINPTIQIPKEASDIHKITNEIVKDKPTFKAYSKALFQYFNGKILAGYNIKRFDIPLLVEEFLRCDLELNILGIIDCYEIVTRYEKRDLTWALKFYANEIMENAHSAEHDTSATIKILNGQKFFYNLKNDELFTKMDTLDFAGKIDKEGRYTFGKTQKGKLVTEDVGFAHWMLKNDFTMNTKSVVLKLLNNK